MKKKTSKINRLKKIGINKNVKIEMIIINKEALIRWKKIKIKRNGK